MDILQSPHFVIHFLTYMDSYQDMISFAFVLWTDARFNHQDIQNVLCTSFEKLVKRKLEHFGKSDQKSQFDFAWSLLNELPTKSFLTGSFLLHCITNPPDWQPNDVDIFIWHPTKQDIETIIKLAERYSLTEIPLVNLGQSLEDELKETRRYLETSLDMGLNTNTHFGCINLVCIYPSSRPREEISAKTIDMFIDMSFDFQCCKLLYQPKSNYLKIRNWNYTIKNKLETIEINEKWLTMPEWIMKKNLYRLAKYTERRFIKPKLSHDLERRLANTSSCFTKIWMYSLDQVYQPKKSSENIFITATEMLRWILIKTAKSKKDGGRKRNRQQ